MFLSGGTFVLVGRYHLVRILRILPRTLWHTVLPIHKKIVNQMDAKIGNKNAPEQITLAIFL